MRTEKMRSFISFFLLSIGSFSYQSTDAVARTNCTNVIVDKVWSGTPTGPTAISTPNAIFAAYYNQFRYMTVAKIDLSTCRVETKQLSSQFGGYDNHNYISMKFDKRNILHISGNMHNVPLVYFRASKPFDISSLTKIAMTNQSENSVTYPAFFFIGSDLYFMYRNGASGNGQTYINRYFDFADIGAIGNGFRPNTEPVRSKSKWVKHLAKPIFSNSARVNGKSSSVNAYPSTISFGPDNYFYIAVVWRSAPDVLNNYAMSFVKTRDFVNWFDMAGRAVSLPVSSDKKNSLVAEFGSGSGLVNNAKVSFTASGEPVILYTKYVDTSNGKRNGIFAARYQAGKWTSLLLASSSALRPIVGTGALSGLPNFSGLTLHGSVAVMTYQFDGEPRYNLNLDSETLLPTANMPVPASTLKVASSPVPALAALEGDTNAAIRSAGYENLGGPLMSLRYRALPANNDKPFTCPPRPAAYCNPPPSALVLDTLWPK